MDAEAVERVLDAMMDVPVNLDKRALRDDLGSAEEHVSNDTRA